MSSNLCFVEWAYEQLISSNTNRCLTEKRKRKGLTVSVLTGLHFKVDSLHFWFTL